MSLSDIEIRECLASNAFEIHERMRKACLRTGRATNVELIAVTKYTPLNIVSQLVKLGHNTFGENRPQQLIERDVEFPEANWHLIGQLQSNKVRAVLPHVNMIHSVDSLKLLRRIHSISQELNCSPEVLLQVNISGEKSKSGFSTADILKDWDEIVAVSAQVRGLMTMAPLTDEGALVRKTFRGLRELRDELQQRSPDLKLNHLSMGMSGDFEIAIEEGATLIRVGSLLFQGCVD